MLSRTIITGLFLAMILSEGAAATLQVRDTLRWGGIEFVILQYPLEPLLRLAEQKEGRSLLKSNNTANHKGYTAAWGIDRKTLYLEKFEGTFDGVEVPLSRFIDGKLPKKAKWFSGIIEVPVGEFSYESQSWAVLIEIGIENGEVVSINPITNGKERYMRSKEGNVPHEEENRDASQ
jgi:hypothetical protein